MLLNTEELAIPRLLWTEWIALFMIIGNITGQVRLYNSRRERLRVLFTYRGLRSASVQLSLGGVAEVGPTAIRVVAINMNDGAMFLWTEL
jgi:hypothetical protein